MFDLCLLCVDRDGDAHRRAKLANLENQAKNVIGEGRAFLAENAWQEVEVWLLMGHDLPRKWDWRKIREEIHPKERYYQPFAESRGMLDLPDEGRDEARPGGCCSLRPDSRTLQGGRPTTGGPHPRLDRESSMIGHLAWRPGRQDGGVGRPAPNADRGSGPQSSFEIRQTVSAEFTSRNSNTKRALMNRDKVLARITIDPNVCFGKPCIRGRRIWVSLVLDFLASGWSTSEVLENYPGLEEADIRACIAYGAEMYARAVRRNRGLRVAHRKTAKTMVPIPDPDYGRLVGGIADLLDAARRRSARAVDSILTSTYWEVGGRIVQHEQRGKVRAEYGTSLLERLSKDLKARCGRGFSRQNLQQMRLFYLGWQIISTPSRPFQAVAISPGQAARSSPRFARHRLANSHQVKSMGNRV